MELMRRDYQIDFLNYGFPKQDCMQIYNDFGVELGVWIARGRTPERDELWMEYI